MMARKDEGAAQKNEQPSSSHWSLDKGQWQYTTDRREKYPESHTRRGERNPFVAFKHFVDGSFRALTLPLTRRQEWLEAKKEADSDSWTRWLGADWRAPAMDRPNAMVTAVILLSHATEKTKDIDLHKIEQLFADHEDEWVQDDPIVDGMLAFGGACYFSPDVGDRLPSSAQLFRQNTKPPRWLSIDWFKRSSYSPVQVEAMEDGPGHECRWRAAFEDLMSVSLDRQMLPLFQSRLYSPETWNEPGLNWTLSLQYRGILPPLLESWRRTLIDNPVTGGVSSCSLSTSGLRWTLPPQLRHVGDPQLKAFVDEIAMAGRGCSFGAGYLEQNETLEADSNLLTTSAQQAVDTSSDLSLCNERVYTAADSTRQDQQSVSTQPKASNFAVVATTTTSETTLTPDGTKTVREITRRQYADGTEETYDSTHSTRGLCG